MVYMNSTNAELSTEDKKFVVDIIVEYVMGGIGRKEWKLGTKILTEFELVETLKVNRSFMREAIKMLIALGLLEIRRAGGTYMMSRLPEKIMTLWAYSLLLEDDDSLVLLELRMVIERGTFSFAIQKGTKEDMRVAYDAFEHFIALVQDVQVTPPEVLDADIRYRERTCEAPYNHLAACPNDMIAFVSPHSREKSTEEAIAYNDRFHMVGSYRKPTEAIMQRRAADLNEVLSYRYRYWGIALQNQKQKNSRSAV